MTDTELNEALARWAGWTPCFCGDKNCSAWFPPSTSNAALGIPDFCNDLIAVHELEARLDGEPVDVRSLYYDFLLLVTPRWPEKGKLLGDDFEMDWKIVRANARERSEALARAVGVWRDE